MNTNLISASHLQEKTDNTWKQLLKNYRNVASVSSMISTSKPIFGVKTYIPTFWGILGYGLRGNM